MCSKERIYIYILNEVLRQEKLQKFIDFCFKISDEVSLNDFDPRLMTKEEAKEARAARYKYKARQKGNENEEETEMINEFDEDTQRDAELFMKSEQEVKAFNKIYLGQYSLMKREVTCMTHCTLGGEKVVYYFKNDESIKKRFDSMEDLFSRIMLDEKIDFTVDDPAFYKQGELVLSVCSHERFGCLILDEVQYKEFRELRIPHNIQNPSRMWSLAELIEEAAYQEREKLTIMEAHQQYIPEQIGKIRTLKDLEIFDHEVTYLPESLQELVELECLRITGNQVTTLGFDISKLKKLKILDLGGMPLKVFPEGITELKQLEEIYLSGSLIKEVPEEIMKLDQLKVLSLPEEIELSHLSADFLAFIEKTKPKKIGISLREILGEEEWEKIREKSIVIGS